jgi:hypothetical protein
MGEESQTCFEVIIHSPEPWMAELQHGVNWVYHYA